MRLWKVRGMRRFSSWGFVLSLLLVTEAAFALTVSVDSRGGDPTGLRDSTAAVRSAIQAAISSGKAEVIFSSGSYLLSCGDSDLGPCLTISGAKNGISFRGTGATNLVIGNPLSGFLSILDSSDVALQGFTVDYNTPPFTQGVIKAKGKTTIDVSVEAGYPTFEHRMFAPGLLGQTFGMLFDRSQPQMKGSADNYYYINSASKLANNSFRLSLGGSSNTVSVKVGDRFAVPLRAGFPLFYFQGNQNLSISQVTAYTGTNLGSAWVENSGRILIDGLQIRRAPGKTRLLSSAADAIHMMDNPARLVIKNSYIEGMGDDAINIRSRAYSLVEVRDSKVIRLQLGDGSPQPFPLKIFAVGQTLQAVDRNSKSARGTARIRAIASDGSTATITLDRAVAGMSAGDLVFNADLAMPYALIKDNTFSNFRGMLRVRSRGAVFYGNKFLDQRNARVFISADINDSWKEGPSLIDTPERPVFYGNVVSGSGGRITLLGINYASLGSPSQSMDDLSAHPLVFNARFYRAMNEGLAGMSDSALREHWLRHGISEQRWASPVFNVAQYMQAYPDIGNFYGWSDMNGALLHFVLGGYSADSRQGSIETNALVYNSAQYGDINRDLGGDDMDKDVHWLRYGINEGRRGNSTFYSVNYLNRYADLRAAYGATNYRMAIWHYVISGKKEGRDGS